MDEQEKQVAQYHLQQMQSVLENIDTQLTEVSKTKEALENLKHTKGNEDMLCNIANGIFVHATLKPIKTVHVNVGNDIVVEKSIDDAIALMDRQHQDIMVYRDELTTKMNSVLPKME